MKIYALRNADYDSKIDLAYVICFEKIQEYYIEIVQGIDEWNYPFILDSYVRQGLFSVGSEDTMLFIEQRIIPKDRQNIGMILKDNGLEEYDEWKLFILADGRCAQDECYIKQISYDVLPSEIKARLDRRIVHISHVSNSQYLIAFKDGTVGVLELEKLLNQNAFYKRMLTYTSLSQNAYASTSGMEWMIAGNHSICCDHLYANCTKLPITLEDLLKFAKSSTISSQEMTSVLACSRQNINDLVKRGRLEPIDTQGNITLFSKTELLDIL